MIIDSRILNAICENAGREDSASVEDGLKRCAGRREEVLDQTTDADPGVALLNRHRRNVRFYTRVET
jgi:hypothetical protein